ncbi:hypothetical protein HN011_010753 [Eciton burchellii]|nr:hypothetical protein HN011_010753 [Eciton burchellii]
MLSSASRESFLYSPSNYQASLLGGSESVAFIRHLRVKILFIKMTACCEIGWADVHIYNCRNSTFLQEERAFPKDDVLLRISLLRSSRSRNRILLTRTLDRGRNGNNIRMPGRESDETMRRKSRIQRNLVMEMQSA